MNERETASPTGRSTLLTVVLAVVVTTASTMMLWRVLDVVPLLIGTGLGVGAGLAIGLLIGTGRLSSRLRWLASAAIAAAAVTVAGGDLDALRRVPRIVATFLTVGLPAAGLDGLAVIPTIIALPATALVVWGARWRRPAALIGGTISGLLGASLLAVPRGVPPLPLIFTAVGFAALLFIDAHSSDERLEPLIPDAPGDTVRPAMLVGALAVAGATIAGAAAAMIPNGHAVDLRNHVDSNVVVVLDDSPLAIAARQQTAPPGETMAAATVVGPSPGRLRMAVLDSYQPEGWGQQAAFAVTGRSLVGDPLFGTADDGAPTAVITIRPGEASTGLRGLPTAGAPLSVAAPDEVRYSAAAGVLLANRPVAVEYTTAIDVPLDEGVASAPGTGVEPSGETNGPATALVGSVPTAISGCPASARLQAIATDLSTGTTDPLERMARIESWLKLKRIYDPTALGGQTLGSVEQFVDTDLARGNMEAFVTATALLARCAGVPVRVVVGLPAPAADSVTEYQANQLTAWIEVPMSDGWQTIDPIPTPSEQQRQAELAQQPPTPPPPPGSTTPPPTPPLVVPPTQPPADRSSSGWMLIAGAVLLLLLGVWTIGAPWLVRRRRARLADPAAAVLGAWDTAVDRLIDHRLVVHEHHTASEFARTVTGRAPRRAVQMLTVLAKSADHARFDAATITDGDAAEAWAVCAAITDEVGISPWSMVVAARHPQRIWRRLRAAGRGPRRSGPWSGQLPDELAIPADSDLGAIPGFQVDAQIGAGSTAVVYRGRRLDDDQPVAIKVFSFAVDERSYDRQRFEWEAQVAGLVSGQPNLPEVLASGLTASGRPYVVSAWYSRGTVADRIRRGGPLSPGEVLGLGQALALALDTLHRSSILHGDVKPENVFISSEGTPILGDLGSAWLRAEGGPAASMTPPYAAPEVWLGQHPSPSSDVYSLGLTLMFAASGRPPIAGAPPSTDEIIESFGTDVYLPLLEIDPRRRPRTALDAARLLGADVDDPSLAARTSVVLPTPTLLRDSRPRHAAQMPETSAAERSR